MTVLDAVTLGDITVDIVARVPEYPPLGGDSLAERVDVRAGGSAANTAIVLRKFGLSVGIIARVGEDILAGHALSDLREAGVSLSCVQRDAEEMTGLVFAAVTPDGERTFFSCRGANPRTEPELTQQSVIREARLLHVSGYALVESPQRETARQAIEAALEVGVPVTLDPGVEVTTTAREEILAILSKASMVYPNRGVAEWLTGERDPEEAVEVLLSHGPEVVALKLGDRGCLIGSSAGLFRVPAFTVDAFDDTGAGDSFNAALILGRLDGLSLRESGLLANALGALATNVTGAGISLPGREAALSFLEKHREEATWQGWTAELGRVRRFLAQGSIQ
jgi:ribokinase